jgi:hypothetical protein
VVAFVAMLLYELNRRCPTHSDVRTDFIVGTAALKDVRSKLLQGLMPLDIQALVAQLSIEALVIAVLYGMHVCINMCRTPRAVT